jgi:hypothetical protein
MPSCHPPCHPPPVHPPTPAAPRRRRRNAFRGTPRAFALDGRALSWAQRLLEVPEVAGWPLHLRVSRRGRGPLLRASRSGATTGRGAPPASTRPPVLALRHGHQTLGPAVGPVALRKCRLFFQKWRPRPLPRATRTPRVLQVWIFM